MHKPITTLFFYIIIVLILFSLFFFYKLMYLSPQGFENIFLESNLIKPIIFSFFTILGILSRFLYNEIKNTSNSDIKILELLYSSLKKKNIWIAILISPIIILSFYRTLDDLDNLALIVLISYQNGFFFQTIFESKNN